MSSVDPLDIARELGEHLTPSLRESLMQFTQSWVDRTPMVALLQRGLAELLESITATNFRQLSGDDVSKFDAILDGWRSWARAWQIEILPRCWSFMMPVHVAHLATDEAETSIVFRADAEVGSVFRVRQFGWAIHDRIRSPAQVSVSAGFAPAEFGELEALVKSGDGEIESCLRSALKGWRELCLSGTLEATAVKLFVDFVDRHQAMWMISEPEKSQEFCERLLVLLHEEFGLVPFYPQTFHEFPDGWVRIPDGVWMQTGRVVRVLRPGLQDRDGKLRIPARVEVE